MDLINSTALYESSAKNLPEKERDELRVSPYNTSDNPLHITGTVDFDDNIEQDFADGIVSAIKAVYKTINGVKVGEFNSTYEEATIIGITRTAATDGDKLKYKTIGKLEDSSLNFPINASIYLGISGALTDTPPATGFRTRVGSSNGAGSIQILIEEPIIL